jgi:hypothetical protein
LGGGVLPGRGYTDGWLVKLSAASGAHLWSKRLGGNRPDMPANVVFDTSGNLYASGYFGGVGDFGGTLTAADDQDMFVVKYAPNGTYIAGKAFGGVGADNPSNVAVWGGFAGLVGYFYGTANNYGGTVLSSAGQSDAVVVRFSM